MELDPPVGIAPPDADPEKQDEVLQEMPNYAVEQIPRDLDDPAANLEVDSDEDLGADINDDAIDDDQPDTHVADGAGVISGEGSGGQDNLGEDPEGDGGAGVTSSPVPPSAADDSARDSGGTGATSPVAHQPTSTYLPLHHQRLPCKPLLPQFLWENRSGKGPMAKFTWMGRASGSSAVHTGAGSLRSILGMKLTNLVLVSWGRRLNRQVLAQRFGLK